MILRICPNPSIDTYSWINQILPAYVHIEHVLSCVGSGDCLTAGIAFAIHKEMNIENIAKWGVACGAANCLREDLGMLYKNDVDKLYPVRYDLAD